jgi:uncharacterized membrane protein YccC
MTGSGLVWLHILKTLTAAFLAMGIAMLLQLSSPRTAITTVFVLMQPLSGMVLAKSFYRVIGTAIGMIAAVTLGAIFPQQPVLYMLGITAWIGTCTAAAVRYRHFRWYAFVLAGYTTALIGIPAVMAQNGLFLAALTRAAEVTIGILCSSAISTLVLPIRSSTALQRTLRIRYSLFSSFAANTLEERVDNIAFETRFADLVDQIVGFEAVRGFASFEDPNVRVRSRRLARLNSEFMNVCTRLHALHQLLKRMHADQEASVLEAASPYLRELSNLLVSASTPMDSEEVRAARAAVELGSFQSTLPQRVRKTRRSLEPSTPDLLLDFDTTMELLHRFVVEFLSYTRTYASLNDHNHALEQSVTKYEVKTNAYVVAFTFLRTVVAVAAMGAFWIATAWPSGGMAVIGAAIACALCSASAGPTRFAAQMAAGAGLATITGYLVTCYIYPEIDGFPLLCVALAPLLAFGAFLSMRPSTSGYGVGFCVFFCLLAGPDNRIVYAPDLIINNGIAIVASILVSCIVFAVVLPAQMPWRIEKIKRDLRRQMVLACEGRLTGLDQRFQSSTHDLMFQLRTLLIKQSEQHRDALLWMLLILEVGHAVIDLRNETVDMPYADRLQPGWRVTIETVERELADLFVRPGKERLTHTLASVGAAIHLMQSLRDALHGNRERNYQMQRILSCLHSIQAALLDKDVPFYAKQESGHAR